MKFKSFCYETWLDYMEECLCYNMPAMPYTDWAKIYKWHLRKLYRLRYNKLQSEWQSGWKPDYERILPK